VDNWEVWPGKKEKRTNGENKKRSIFKKRGEIRLLFEKTEGI